MRRWALLLAAALMVSGCEHPLIPDPAPKAPETAASLGKSDRPALGAGGPVLGVNLYALSNYRPSTVRADGARMLGYIKRVLKADAVAIAWNFYTPSPTRIPSGRPAPRFPPRTSASSRRSLSGMGWQSSTGR